MDGPLISTQQTVLENDFNAKQRPERLHFKIGDLKSGNQGLYSDYYNRLLHKTLNK